MACTNDVTKKSRGHSSSLSDLSSFSSGKKKGRKRREEKKKVGKKWTDEK